jgi:hypothetical protein
MAKRKSVSDARIDAWQKFKTRYRIINDPGSYIQSAFIVGWCECMADAENRRRARRRKQLKKIEAGNGKE